MFAIAKVLLRSAGVDVVGSSDGLKTIMIFCGVGLLLSILAAMTYGLNLERTFSENAAAELRGPILPSARR